MRDRDLPNNWPKNLEEFKEILRSDGLIQYLEERGIELRFDERTDKVTIRKTKEFKRE